MQDTNSGSCIYMYIECAVVGIVSEEFQTGNRPDHEQQRCYRHAPTVKSEAANAVVSS